MSGLDPRLEPLTIGEGLWLYQGVGPSPAARRAVLADRLAAAIGCRAQELRFGQGESGKPFLLPPFGPWQFSLAHRRDLLLIAAAPGEALGCDLELLGDGDPLDRGVAENFFSGGERAWLDSMPAGRRTAGFLVLWTGKEALLKRTGQGIGRNLTDIDLGSALIRSHIIEDGAAIVLGDVAVSWFFRDLGAGTAIIALARSAHDENGKKKAL